MNYRLICLPVVALAAACASEPESPKRVELTKHFQMIDEQGAVAGKVTFKPLGEGEIRDNDGRLIGIIAAPPAGAQ